MCVHTHLDAVRCVETSQNAFSRKKIRKNQQCLDEEKEAKASGKEVPNATVKFCGITFKELPNLPFDAWLDEVGSNGLVG